MRTYSRDAWNEAQDLWADFSTEWRNVRHQAAMRGILYPPSGTKWDSWEDENPSQRAILIRAIRETPKLLNACVARGSSWSEIIAALLRARDDWRDEIDEKDRRAATSRREENPTHREAVQSIAAILDRIDGAR